jgi:hypothetical protein
MSRAIRFKQEERAAVADALDVHTDEAAPWKKGLRSLLAKMDKASEPKPESGLGWKRFAEICKEELGDRLSLPANPAAGWYSRISAKLRELGVTEDDAREAAEYVASWRRQAVGLEYLASRVPELLTSARAKQKPGGTSVSGGAYRPPEFE